MKKKIETILSLIRIMEQNTFLLKDSFSETIELLSSEYAYRTYVGSRGDINRYIHIYLYIHGEELVEIEFRGNDIKLIKNIEYKFSVDDCVNVMQLIYKELHSFENHNEDVLLIKKKLADHKNMIKTYNKELAILQKELDDCLLLNKTK